MPPSAEQRFRINSRIVLTPMGEGSALIDRQTGECYELNRLGTAVWSKLTTGDSVTAIVAGISAEYDVPAQQVESDVGQLIADLVAHGLLVLLER